MQLATLGGLPPPGQGLPPPSLAGSAVAPGLPPLLPPPCAPTLAPPGGPLAPPGAPTLAPPSGPLAPPNAPTLAPPGGPLAPPGAPTLAPPGAPTLAPPGAPTLAPPGAPTLPPPGAPTLPPPGVPNGVGTSPLGAPPLPALTAPGGFLGLGGPPASPQALTLAAAGAPAPAPPAPPAMPEDVKEQLLHLREDLRKLTAAAEEAAENGDDSGAKFKQMLAGDIKEKIEEIEEKYPEPPPAPAAPAPPPQLPVPALPGMTVALNGAPAPWAPFLPPPRPGLPLPPPPGLPGLPPPPGTQDWQRTAMLYQNPDAAMNITQQRAMEYEQEKALSMAIEPEVVELAHHFQLTDRHARMLDEQLKKRNDTYEDDIAAMYEILKGAKNPADLLMVSIRWMAEGVFNGTKTPNPDVEKAAKKYKLDAPSACKLAEVLEGRKDPDDDLRKVCSHLERSNKPSSLVMMMLKNLKAGNPVDDCKKAPAIGSYLHKIEMQKQDKERDKRSRSRGRGGDRDRGRSRSRQRRSRSRRRERSRSRKRSRSRRRD